MDRDCEAIRYRYPIDRWRWTAKNNERIGSLNRIYPGFQKYLDWDILRKEVRGVVFR